MKKLAEIDCACGCEGRVKLYWHKKKIVAIDSHGKTHVVEQHYEDKTLRCAVENIAGWYGDYSTWHLTWAAYANV